MNRKYTLGFGDEKVSFEIEGERVVGVLDAEDVARRFQFLHNAQRLCDFAP